ncbi:MAG: hypothetical protein Q4G58_09300 [bacterium]|nr:hypothetical protein [bacterium]
MSKQSNQRYRKELEKYQSLYSETIRNAAKVNSQNSISDTNESTSKDCYNNSVDRNEK